MRELRHKKYSRRSIWLVSVISVAACQDAVAQATLDDILGRRGGDVTLGATQSDEYLPWDAISAPDVLPEQPNSVVLFFDFHCPFSREIHVDMRRWAHTLPEQYFLVEVPAADSDSLPFYMALSATLARLDYRQGDALVESLYRAIQDAGHPKNIDTLHHVLAQMGAGEVLPQVLREKELIEWVQGLYKIYARVQQGFEPDRTPTIVYGGRFRVHYDHVAGNGSHFLQLGNAMISMLIRGEHFNAD